MSQEVSISVSGLMKFAYGIWTISYFVDVFYLHNA